MAETVPYTANIEDLNAFLRGGFGDEIAFSVSWLQPGLAVYNPLRQIARVRTVLRAPFERLMELPFIPGQSAEDFLDSCALHGNETGAFVHGAPHIRGFGGFLSAELDVKRVGLDPVDALIDLVYSIPASLRVSSRFAMSGDTLRHMRTLRDWGGDPIWRPTDTGDSLLGFPVAVLDGMPTEARQPAIGFGDWLRFFEIRDGQNVTVRRDGRSLIVTRTVDCEVRAPAAVRFLAF